MQSENLPGIYYGTGKANYHGLLLILGESELFSSTVSSEPDTSSRDHVQETYRHYYNHTNNTNPDNKAIRSCMVIIRKIMCSIL